MELSFKFWFLITKGTGGQVPGTIMMEENTSLVQCELQTGIRHQPNVPYQNRIC